MTESTTGISRRTLVKGAAWSVPVLAVAAATPMAAASVNSATVQWVGGASQLLSLTLLDGGVVSATILPSAPTQLRVTNTPGIVPNVTARFDVAQATGISVNLGVGDVYLRGFAPRTVPGATIVGSTTVTPRILNDGLLGDLYAQDTSTTFALGDIASGATVDLGSIGWAVTGRSGINIAIDVLVNFSVTASFFSNGTQFAQLTSPGVSVPIGAGIL
ncbi:hypothetical protein ACWIBQ_00935 [Microbacterium keratanolyticum]